jgi:hypothetical protein
MSVQRNRNATAGPRDRKEMNQASPDSLRAIVVLEHIGAAESQQLLPTLAWAPPKLD